MLDTLRRARVPVYLAAGLLLSALLFDPKLYTGGDNAVYLILGRSLATGQGYTNLHLPGTPPHTDYPPGFPALLALKQLLLGPDVISAKLMVVLFGLAGLFFIWRLLQRLLGDQAHAAAWFALSIPPLVTYNHWILTEIPFLAVSTASLYFLHKAETEPTPKVLPGLVLALAALTLRAAGVALVLAVLLTLLLRRRWLVLAGFGITAVVLTGAWLWRNALTGSSSSYLSQLLARDPYVAEFGRVGIWDMALRAGRNFCRYTFTLLPEAIVPLVSARPLSFVTGTALVLLAALGALAHRRRLTVVERYAGLAGLMVLFWPEVWSGERFLVPFLPLVVIFVVRGLVLVQQRSKRTRTAAIVLAAFMVLNALSLGRQAAVTINDNLRYLRGDRLAGYSPDWRRYFECIAWLEQNTKPDDVIMARKPEFVYLLSNRRSFCYPFTNDRVRVYTAVLAADYVLFDNFRWTETTKHFLNPVLADHRHLFRFVHQTDFPQFFVLAVNKP